MIEAPQKLQSRAQQTAVIHLTLPPHEMPGVMRAAIDELIGAITTQGAGPVGPLYTCHRRNPTDTFDLEVGFPVSKPIAPAGRVQPGRIPAARVARTTYHGSYEGLGDGWGALMGWIRDNGHRGAETLWERYVAGPETGADASHWQTELNRPLLD